MSRPFGLRLLVHTRTSASFGDIEFLEIKLRNDRMATITASQKAPWEGGANFEVELTGFETASEADEQRSDLIATLQLAAMNAGFPLLIRSPPTLFDQRQSGAGFQMRGFGTVGWSPERFAEFISKADQVVDALDDQSRLALELLTASELEASDRARFVSCVSALEPLAAPVGLGEDVTRFVGESLELLKRIVTSSHESYVSLKSRLDFLRKESIRQSIKRLISETLDNDKDAAKAVERAYGLRSELLHSGKTSNSVNLAEERKVIADVIRRIIKARMGLESPSH